jgi:hypothetical protein
MARGLPGRNGVIVAVPGSVVIGLEPGHAPPIHIPTTQDVTVSAVPPRSNHVPPRLHGVPVRIHLLYTLRISYSKPLHDRTCKCGLDLFLHPM